MGIWVGESEGGKFWLRVCSELNNRGVKDILIACIDGLKGFPDAIRAVFPETEIQLCIIHMIRNSTKYVPHKHVKEFIRHLKAIYQAPSEEHALPELKMLQEKWEKKYPFAVKPWITHWDNIKPFYQFLDPLRKMIYTTNALESLHRQFRKVTKNRSLFPPDKSLVKLLFLSIQDVPKKWGTVWSWREILGCLRSVYGDRVVVRNN